MIDDLPDTSFLADLTGFLDECEASTESTERQRQERGTDDLLLDSHKLVAETEALLASCGDAKSSHSVSIQNTSQVTTSGKVPIPDKSTFAEQSLADKKREIRKQQAAKRRNKYRNKLRNERQMLEEQEILLTDELAKLQHTRKKIKSLREKDAAVPAWRAIATRQMEGRLVAEAQQQRLQSAVEHRDNLISELGAMVQQRLYGSTGAICDGERVKSDVQIVPEDIVLLDEYLQSMDAIYSQTDEVFRACGVDKAPQYSFKEGPQRKVDGDVEYFDNLDVLLIPYSFEQTCSAMWQSMLFVHRQRSRQQYSGVTDPENTIAVKFRIPCPRESGEPVNMLILLVTRRYVEADRMVLVWRALSEGEGDFTGMHSDETGWCVTRAVNAEAGDIVVMPTVMQTFVRFIPMSVGVMSRCEYDVNQFTKLVVLSGEEDGVEVARMMESLLLDDTDDART
ncbi:hypothetical protein PHYBOEH_009729 [Phytophthora boehmeriae]|uniref:Uncharacterized protein n=1 Tax=Phytophthora boehmeriae TaxID=109152 RepID=A0A8T1VR90_9STRA|nr:hypothetical protein PHYBOEH_009729 [Phytophthora boehmeriae]